MEQYSTDREIFDGITEKDSDAFEYLYRHYFDMIRRYVVGNSGSEEDALDVFQDGVVALWINIKKGKYELQANVRISTYLFSICKNIWLNQLKQKDRGSLAVLEQQVSDEAETTEVDDSYEEILLLEKMMLQLGKKCRQLLKLFYYEKKSMREIASEMKYTEKSVKNQKYRCMQKLRELYEVKK